MSETSDTRQPDDPLELFHPLIRGWFTAEIGTPTEAQSLAWPRIAAGEHVLVSAPTGSGKTLTAFLWAIDRLITGAWSGDRIRVLYISPLRALNTDVRRNLRQPLDALRERFELAGSGAARVQVMTRSGDTPQSERRKMLRHPPEILVTTPESLNILLTSRSGRTLLADVRAVILDEIHALAASKRGTHLLTAVERLVDLAGEFQRVALSATVKPMETVAEMVGGFELVGANGDGGRFVPRPVSIVRSTASKTYDVKVRFPVELDAESELDDDSMWRLLTRDFRRVIEHHRSTLLFANSRRMTEKATRLINLDAASELAYSHHGSLSREVRSVVEKRLKDGELRAIVATNSLELGIDIGDLDQVLLIQTPRSVASAVQRVGRAGHGVGEVSRGLFYPTFGRDLLESAVVARAVTEQDIEALRPVRGPLDVLAQVILSMATFEALPIDELYDRLRRSWPYRHLLRRHFDRVLDMLAGRFAETRVRELKARVHLDRVRGTVKARPGVERLLYMAGGTIADRGYFALRHQETMAKIGELDEEFVWERSIGDSFTLGTQSWRIQRITHNDVLVTPGRGPAGIAPFWRADAEDRGFDFCQRVAAFLERCESRLEDERFRHELEGDWRLEPKAAEELLRFLGEQREATGGHLPRRDRLLVEQTADRTGKSGSRQLILHTMWGGSVNRPFGMALAAAWDEKYPDPLEVFHDDYCVLMRLPEDFDVAEVLALVPPDRVEQLLRSRLEDTGFFGSRFRWAAGTSLLLPKTGFRQRMPLWMSRQKAKKLYDAVRSDGDFPMVVETWRTCLQDEFELEALKKTLGRLREGSIELQRVSTARPSPFCAGLVWQYTNQFMYDDDTPEKKGPGLRHDVLEELVHAGHLRPRLPPALVERFRAKAQRLEPGYAPAPGEELALWLEERLVVPRVQWRRLLAAVARDHELEPDEVLASVAGRALEITLPGSHEPAVGVAEGLVRVLDTLDLPPEDAGLRALVASGGPEALERLETLRRRESAPEVAPSAPEVAPLEGLVGEWLRFDGPVPADRLAGVFDLGDDLLAGVFDALEEARTVVIDELCVGAAGPEVCDAENLEILLRWLRSDRRPSFEAREAAELPLFMAHHQGLVEKGDGLDGLQDALERLFGLALPAALWESDVLPARLSPYYPSWLDACLQQSELLWLGCGKEKTTFAFESDLELLRDAQPASANGAAAAPEAAAPEAAEKILAALAGTSSASAEELSASTGLSPVALHDELWRLAWQGAVSNETWLAVRRGLANDFQPIDVPARRPAPRRGRRRGWRPSASSSGRWRRLETETAELDALEREELIKDRVRLLLTRYGVLFRQLVARELPPFAWSQVFRTLRLMELSGEVLAGYFFKGVRGLQFIAHGAFRELERGLPRDAVFWLSAADPASLAGVAVEGLKERLPARRQTTHLVYRGTELVLVSTRRGGELEIRVSADHARLGELLAPLENLLTREVEPLPSIAVEAINGEAAAESAYARPLGELFRTVREGKVLRLWKRF